METDPEDRPRSENLTFTQLVERIRRSHAGGDGEVDRAVVVEQMLRLVYDELHALARMQMQGIAGGHTLQATALVNEAYLRLFSREERTWENKQHFMSFAAQAMRSVLVDYSRKKGRIKRQADGERMPLDQVLEDYEQRSESLVDLNAALERLAQRDETQVKLVELRFFAGCKMKEAADLLGMPLRTAQREWSMARAWLRAEVERGRERGRSAPPSDDPEGPAEAPPAA